MQALEKSLDMDLDVCKVLRDIPPKDDMLNQVRMTPDPSSGRNDRHHLWTMKFCRS